MLFTSPEFLFAFLPIALAGYFLIGRWHWRAAFAWLGLVSLIFYGWWRPEYVLLLLGSILVNYAGGLGLLHLRDAGRDRAKRHLLIALIATNISLLLYFKYLLMLVETVNSLTQANWHVATAVLPIGISFFTFTQITYLVDASRGKVGERSFINYLLFVTYFPHLLAGPILHHSDVMPQFSRPGSQRPDSMNLARGVTFLAIGLFKKLVLAAQFSPIADHGFAQAGTLGTLDAWLGVLAYTLQIYFDFSGYSDMAIGLSLMFNIRLPINFDSPLRATNISDFWRRWHVTLSRLIRDYLYVPLGGNRLGYPRQMLNLLIAMIIGGLWHGASWNFAIWGGLHGLFLITHQSWRRWRGPARRTNLAKRLAGQLATVMAFAFAFAFFRAENLDQSLAYALGLLGLRGFGSGMSAPDICLVLAGLVLVMSTPSSNRIMGYLGGDSDAAAANGRLHWSPSLACAALTALLLFIAALAGGTAPYSEPFVYFQF